MEIATPMRVTPGGAVLGVEGPRLSSAVDFTREEYDTYLKMTRGQYFLLKLRGVDLATHCANCGAGRYPIPSHDYFTLMCVERPWKGNWQDALYAYSAVTRDPMRRHALLKGIPLLETGHPETARQLLSGPGEDALVFAIGALEPIDKFHADALAQRINDIGSCGYGWTPFILD